MEPIGSKTPAAPISGQTDRLVAEDDFEEARVLEIVARGPRGALVLTALSVAVVMAVWVAFYVLVFLRRGPIG